MPYAYDPHIRESIPCSLVFYTMIGSDACLKIGAARNNEKSQQAPLLALPIGNPLAASTLGPSRRPVLHTRGLPAPHLPGIRCERVVIVVLFRDRWPPHPGSEWSPPRPVSYGLYRPLFVVRIACDQEFPRNHGHLLCARSLPLWQRRKVEALLRAQGTDAIVAIFHLQISADSCCRSTVVRHISPTREICANLRNLRIDKTQSTC
jgi:hypothetical protein